MNLKATKTPLVIAALATAVTLSTFLPANAKAYWASAEAEAAQVIDANFKIKVHKHKNHGHYIKPKHKNSFHVRPSREHRFKHGYKRKHPGGRSLRYKLHRKKRW